MDILISAVFQILQAILSIYFWIVIARALISWVNPDPYNPIVRFLIQVTEPVLSRIRRFVPPFGSLDLSPIVLFLAIIFLQKFLVRTLYDISSSLH